MYEGEDNKVWIKYNETKERWKSYSNKLFIDNKNRDINGQLDDTMSTKNYNICERIGVIEVKDALRKMKLKKIV